MYILRSLCYAFARLESFLHFMRRLALTYKKQKGRSCDLFAVFPRYMKELFRLSHGGAQMCLSSCSFCGISSTRLRVRYLENVA